MGKTEQATYRVLIEWAAGGDAGELPFLVNAGEVCIAAGKADGGAVGIGGGGKAAQMAQGVEHGGAAFYAAVFVCLAGFSLCKRGAVWVALLFDAIGLTTAQADGERVGEFAALRVAEAGKQGFDPVLQGL